MPRNSTRSQNSTLMQNLTRSPGVERLLVFPSPLGFMAMVVGGHGVRRLAFGCASVASAVKAVAAFCHKNTKPADCGFSAVERRWIAELQRYAEGRLEPLGDIPVDFGEITDFQRRVLAACRRIPYGHTMSYAALAALAGSPRAARAVGHCMAANPVPLLTPCHRVIRGDGSIGEYSAVGGAAMKRRLLAMEREKG
jgi:methylated-DNA-[protein]-cysteine S-methyltransferase